MLNLSLVGSWTLASMEHRNNHGKIFLPFGDSPTGQLIYTDNAFMSVHIIATNRSLMKTTNVFQGTNEEKIKAQETYLGYAGTYQYDGKQVFHHVSISSFPNWVGTTQERFVKLEGETLALSTAPFLSSGARETAYLTWKRL